MLLTPPLVGENLRTVSVKNNLAASAHNNESGESLLIIRCRDDDILALLETPRNLVTMAFVDTIIIVIIKPGHRPIMIYSFLIDLTSPKCFNFSLEKKNFCSRKQVFNRVQPLFLFPLFFFSSRSSLDGTEYIRSSRRSTEEKQGESSTQSKKKNRYDFPFLTIPLFLVCEKSEVFPFCS